MSIIIITIIIFSGPYVQHVEVPRLGVESELYHHSSQQCQILNPLSKARDRTCNLMVSSRIH